MPVKDCKWQYMAKLAGNDYEWLEMAEIGQIQLKIIRKRLGLAGMTVYDMHSSNGWKWQAMTESSIKCCKYQEMSVSEKGWIFDDDNENDNNDGEKSSGKPYTQLFWLSILISGGSGINRGYPVWFLSLCRVGVLLYPFPEYMCQKLHQLFIKRNQHKCLK